MVENIRKYVYFRVGKQFCAILEQDDFNLFTDPFSRRAHLSLNEDKFGNQMTDVLGRANNCNVSKIVEGGEIKRL